MKNTVGQVPRKENFFPRDDLVDRLYKQLEADAHLYLTAPRRMGKTALMRHIEDQPRTGYEFHYLVVESLDDLRDYLEDLLKALHSFRTWDERTVQWMGEWMSRFSRIPFSETEITFDGEKQLRDTLEEFKELIKRLTTQDQKKVVLMIDEFPQAVMNIEKQHGVETARQFLQFNREIRQLASSSLRFVITGSISLHVITEKLGATETLNDLKMIDIPFLSQTQAMRFVTQLLDGAQAIYQPETCDKLLQCIGAFHPFYLQLAVQELIEEFENTSQPLHVSSVERALDKIVHRRNDHYFEHYHERLKKVFSEKEFQGVLAILNALAKQQNGLCLEDIQTLANEIDNLSFVLRCLEFDGYLSRNEVTNQIIYRFTSPILQKWWTLRVAGR